ncbi:hypothetical protein AMTRI_Chr07g75900 [Amborella trichopoda]|uniref:Acyl-[acyl-carrier-protein] desaturase n=1 Tax=Amborella trichopoda TaxID=13333 RepID=U5D8X9_AMBTC|nr:stearoyl-[acyl-carrier-protein] 9-desaturase 5, chloroplastic [Amborella trichopoda]ERN18934.1 hypothetical protein AMTR_s00067p00187690 [Amborella trichopoda]|eukprot:XP_011628191.2 stearoyl-[acyl-carrier-protein] 9-desaturase 5, chloroplastic [Amborella trichopoda]
MAMKISPSRLPQHPTVSTQRTSPGSARFLLRTAALRSKDVVMTGEKVNPGIEHHQVKQTMPPEKREIFESIEDWAKTNILVHLKPVEESWQPQDFLPDPSSEGFFESVNEIQKQCSEIPDDYFVCLIGDMITEEALPTYQSMLNINDITRDETGSSQSSWAIWSRAWTAEENRHGDLLNKYLYLCGRVNMRQVEKTSQYLIGSGMDMGLPTDPCHIYIYTSFQERATFISHRRTARHAKKFGDKKLAQLCGAIASDEKRHEIAYVKIVEKLFEIDPNGTLLVFEDLMRRKITMPGNLMYDGQDENLFEHFSSVAQRLEIYTANDYADILEFLIDRWNIAKINCHTSEMRIAQDYICSLAPKIRGLAERAHGKAKQAKSVPFSWIFDREVKL